MSVAGDSQRQSARFLDMPMGESELRIAAARRWMADADVQALVLLCDENVTYYTGFRKTFRSPLGWLQAFVLGTHRATFVVPHHNENLVRHTAAVEEVNVWGGRSRAAATAVQAVLDAVRAVAPAGATIGLELGEGMPWAASVSESDELRAGLATFAIRDVSDRIWSQRMLKTDYEIQLLREAGRIAVHGFRAGLEAVAEGVTEREILKVILVGFIEAGGFDTPMEAQLMIRSGRDRYPIFSARPVDRALERGDQVMLDSGPSLKGYLIDMQRQASVGEPEPLQRTLYDRGLAGFQAALEAIRAGTTVRDVHRAAVEAMREVALPLELHIDFFGHGIGLANHEPPWLREACGFELQEGMVLSVEIPSYDVPEFRVLGGFLEDVVVVTRDGYENLTGNLGHELWISN